MIVIKTNDVPCIPAENPIDMLKKFIENDPNKTISINGADRFIGLHLTEYLVKDHTPAYLFGTEGQSS